MHDCAPKNRGNVCSASVFLERIKDAVVVRCLDTRCIVHTFSEAVFIFILE